VRSAHRPGATKTSCGLVLGRAPGRAPRKKMSGHGMDTIGLNIQESPNRRHEPRRFAFARLEGRALH
jgi:hypothetical protein